MTGDSVIAFTGGLIFLGGGLLSRPPRDGGLVAAGLVLLIAAEAIRVQAEDALAAHLGSADIEADLAPLAPFMAADRLKAWRAICACGKSSRFLTADPSLLVKRKRLPKTGGHPAWSNDEVAACRERWPLGTVQRLSFELVHWTGARISDAVLIGPGMVDRDGILRFVQVKTGEPAFVPWTCALPSYAAGVSGDRDMLHAALATRRVRHMTYLATERPYAVVQGARTCHCGSCGNPPETAALMRQKLEGLRNVEAWWHDRLSEGDLRHGGDGFDEDKPSWDQEAITVFSGDLRRDYEEWLSGRRWHGNAVSERQFGKDMRDMCGGLMRHRAHVAGGRQWQYTVPPLAECRAAFAAFIGGEWSGINDAPCSIFAD